MCCSMILGVLSCWKSANLRHSWHATWHTNKFVRAPVGKCTQIQNKMKFRRNGINFIFSL